jgi:hypothetical protein
MLMKNLKDKTRKETITAASWATLMLCCGVDNDNKETIFRLM